MLKFNGEFNHAYIISYERKPTWFKRLSYLNIIAFLIGQSFQTIAIILVVYNSIIYLLSGNEVIQESISIIKNIGIQIEKKKKNGNCNKIFLNQNIIRDVVIQEGLTTYNVKTYLAIICKNMKNLILPFEYDLSLEQLYQVYYPLRSMIQ